MTKIPVGNAAGSLQTTFVKNPMDFQQASKSGGFQDVMDLYGKAGQTQSGKQNQPAQGQSVKQGKRFSDQNAGKDRIVNRGSDKTQKADAGVSKQQMQKVEQTGQEIVKEVADQLDVTPEEVEAALAALGISAMDLVNSNQMAALVMDLMEIPDSISLLTDADLFADVTALTQSVNDMLAGLSGELNVPLEELPLLDGGASAEVEDGAEWIQADEEMDQLSSLEGLDEVSEKAGEVTAPKSVSVKEDGKAEGITDRQDEVVTDQAAEEDDLTGKPEQKELSQEHTKDKRDGEHHDSPMYKGIETFQAGLEQSAPVEGLAEPPVSRTMMDDIFRQVGDYVRTNVTPDVKEMEIQLSPANLGQVHINIASRNGVITAQITAENEIVKQALEAQVVQLKERLESQGVRIEAVEVTVASHEFERNLDENNENRQSGEQAEQKAGAASRRWNLADLEAGLPEGEELTDAEQVELDMMKLRGGNLNYMV